MTTEKAEGEPTSRRNAGAPSLKSPERLRLSRSTCEHKQQVQETDCQYGATKSPATRSPESPARRTKALACFSANRWVFLPTSTSDAYDGTPRARSNHLMHLGKATQHWWHHGLGGPTIRLHPRHRGATDCHGARPSDQHRVQRQVRNDAALGGHFIFRLGGPKTRPLARKTTGRGARCAAQGAADSIRHVRATKIAAAQAMCIFHAAAPSMDGNRNRIAHKRNAGQLGF